jgi:hypothetical protein
MTQKDRKKYDEVYRRKKATEISLYKQKYYTEHKEKLKANNLAYYYAHREKRIEQMRIYNHL